MRSSPKALRWWPVAAVALLLPLWFVGLFGRGYWTPDEPREADIAWHMKSQQQRALPELGGKPFMEKPPLTYWLTAASMQAFGDTPGAARVPNLAYGIIAALAIGALAGTMAGSAAALTAAVVMASSLLSWRVAVWVAPDAALVAGCALALLGGYRGYMAAPGRHKLLWYTLLHLGALMGFMAKSAPGWLVPGLALLALIVWERRWSELRRPELYAGLLLQLLAIGFWVRAVWLGPGGEAALRVLFWNNLAGRFMHLDAPAQFNYAEGHQNWPAKYFVQLPSYLYPWTLLALAAMVRAWRQLRQPGAQATAWRYAVCLFLPFLLLLTAATTARAVCGPGARRLRGPDRAVA
jgi:4-amino-4-deoxy-L-arabinose transferase-like glycosyltransferase